MVYRKKQTSIYVYRDVYIYVYIYIFIYLRERARESERGLFLLSRPQTAVGTTAAQAFMCSGLGLI